MLSELLAKKKYALLGQKPRSNAVKVDISGGLICVLNLGKNGIVIEEISRDFAHL